MATDPLPDPAPDDLIHRLSQRGWAAARYDLEEEVARGGMGSIIKVWDRDLRRHLAMKVVLGTGHHHSTGAMPSAESNQIARFLEEAQVTSQLDHPGIVPVHEVGLDSEGRVYFTMKLVKGRTLKHIFDLVFEDKEDWNETRALGVILKVCEAMAYAHAKGVIHRDLKPANVMVGSFGEVYVMDWGLSRVLGHNDKHDIRIKPEFTSSIKSVKTERRDTREDTPDSPIVTMDGDVMGTPAYMSPEQARGEIEKLGPQSDVYAIGGMLYHLLARQMPFVPRGERITNRTVLARLIDGPPKPIASLRKDVPAELVAICERAMGRDAGVRYSDTLALADDLRAYLEHRVVSAYETGTWAETKKWIVRNKPLAVSLAAAIVLLVAGLSASLVYKGRADEKATDLLTANTTIQARNKDLAIATKIAQDKEREATQRARDVLSLSAIQDLKNLEDGADKLWPADDPEILPKYEAWLAAARVLIEGRPAQGGLEAKASLLEHEATLAEIRRQAKDLTPEQIEADRRASPDLAEWEKTRAQLQWMRRMLGEEPWPSVADVEGALAKEKLPTDAKRLNKRAWWLVVIDPTKTVWGSEVRGLILAQRALAAAKEPERAEILDTLGWALFRCGRLDLALVEGQTAMDEAQGEMKSEVGASLEELQAQVALWNGPEARSKQSDAAAKLSARVSELQRSVEERRTFEIEHEGARWWHAQLSKLVADLKAFRDEKTGGLFSSGTSERYGWGIVKRADFARVIEERTVSGADARRHWAEAIAAVSKSPKYGGLSLTPQIGLLPIGEDPDSHLWDFAHLQSGDPAERGRDGKLRVVEGMGLVFVLIPGGTFWMGAQSNDESGHNFDPEANPNESPVHEVTLSPYFLSKYEMTQGQWQRFTGSNPSKYGPTTEFNGHEHDLTHPVEQVTWTQCMKVVSRLGLELPSEAQWEYGCRGDTDTPWWTGAKRESLRGKVNLADRTAAKAGAMWPDLKDWPDLEDGWVAHAPVGSLAANLYRLIEVHGNVWEWCRDGYDNYSTGRQLDPITAGSDASARVYRGGSFGNTASAARSADRINYAPENKDVVVGLRPARRISTH